MKCIYFVLIPIHLCLFLQAADAQDITLWSTAGGTSITSNLSLSYSFGEPFVLQNTNDDRWLTEGFQQPESVDLMVRTENTVLAADVRVYPNPTDGLLHLQFEDHPGAGFIRVTDMTGCVLQQIRLDDSLTYTLYLTSLASGVYHIAVHRQSGLPIMTSCLKF